MSAQGLARSVHTVAGMAKKDKLELFNFIRDEMPERLRAYLTANHPAALSAFRWDAGSGRLIVRGSTPQRRLAALQAIPDDLLTEIGTAAEFRRAAEGWIKTSEVGGQVRRDVERVYDALGLAEGRTRGGRILIDGAETEVTLSPRRVEFRGVVPQDVDTDFIEESLQGLGYRFEAQSMAIDQDELVNLTNALNMQLRPRQP